MPSSHFHFITPEMIESFLEKDLIATIYCNGKPLKNDYVQEKVDAKLNALTVHDVREELTKMINAATPLDEINIAACLACEIREMWKQGWYVSIGY